MKKLYLLLSFFILLCANNAFTQVSPVYIMGSAATYDTVYTIPIKVVGFNDIRSSKLTINFDTAIADILSPADITRGPGVGGSLSASISDGVAVISWFTFPGITLPDSTVFINIKFTKVASGTSAILFDDGIGFGCRTFSGATELIDTPNADYYKPGSITFLSDTDAPRNYLPDISDLCPGDAVDVPVTVNFFNGVGEFDLQIDYDPLILNYSSFSDVALFPALTVTNPVAGVIEANGYSTNTGGETLSNGDTLFVLHFNYLGSDTTSAISWNVANCEYKSGAPDYNLLNDLPNSSFYFDGSVTCIDQSLQWQTAPGDLDDSVACYDMAALNAALLMEPVATYACSSTITYTVVKDTIHESNCNGVYTRIREWKASDPCDNTTSVNYVQTIDVVITDPPLAPPPGNSTIQCVDDAIPPVTPIVNDTCGNIIPPVLTSVTDNPDPLTCQGTRTYLYTYTDCANNSVQWEFVYQISLTTPPTEPIDQDATVDCLIDAVEPETPHVADYCGNTIAPVLLSVTDNMDPADCNGTRVYRYSYTDCANNTVNWEFTYIIDLSTPPAVPADGNAIVECLSDAVHPEIPVVTDACGDTLSADTLSVVDLPDPITCEGTRTYNYSFTDCASNTSNWSFTYTIERSTTPAEIGTPVQNVSVIECVEDTVAPVILPVVVDVCGDTLTPSPPVIGGTYVDCEGTVTYEYTYEDCAELKYIWTYTYNIIRSTDPAESGTPVPDHSVIECASQAIVPTTLPVVEDVCGNTLSLSSPVTGGTYVDCEGTITYEYTYVDCADSSFVWIYTYDVQRSTPPDEVGGPVPISSTVTCPDDATPPTTLPIVEDVCGNTLPDPQPTIGGTYVDCDGTITYTYTYTDCASLPFVWTYTYTVDRSMLPPNEVGGPVPVSQTVTCENDAVPPQLPVVLDGCGDTLSPPQPVINGTYTDCEGTIVYNYTYMDCMGEPFNWSFTYNVVLDVAPVLPPDGSDIVECIDDAVHPEIPVVTDACGDTLSADTLSVVDLPDPISCEGTRTYTYSFTDCANNTSIWNFVYTIQRSTIPGEVGTPVQNVSVIECVDDAVAPTTLPVVEDACGNVLTYSSTHQSSNHDGCSGTISYSYVYTDCANLQFTWTYTYDVIRTTPPSEDGGPVSTYGGTIECESDATPPTTLPVVVDVCGETLIAPQNPVFNANLIDCEGTVEYEYTYEDCAGLQFVWTYYYDVIRTTAPSEQGTPVATSSTVECESDAVVPITLPVVVDVCGETLQTPVPAITTNIIDCEGTVEYEYTYEDCAGLQFVWTYTYNVIRTTLPAEQGTPVATSSTIECENDAVAPATLPVVVDVCGETLQPPVPVITANIIDCEGTVEYEYTYEDCTGLQFIWTYTYNVIRLTIPSEHGTPVTTSSTVECESDAIAPAILPVVVDVCGETLQAPVPAITTNIIDCEGTVDYEYTYEDCAGLQFVWTYTYNVIRTTLPAEQGTPVATSSTIECETDTVVPAILPVVADVCGVTLQPSSPVIISNIADCEGTVEYEYTYEDCAGLQFTWTYTYDVIRTTPPSEDGVPVSTYGGTIECESDATLPTTLPVVVDVCGETLIAPQNPVFNANLIDCEGTVEYEYTYEDCAGLQFVWTYYYDVIRTTAPSEQGTPVATSSNVECESDAVAPITLPVVVDACGETLQTPVPAITANIIDCEGTVEYEYTYEDCAGLQFVWTYTYNVIRTTLPAEQGTPVATSSTVECENNAVAPANLPVVVDVCGETLQAPVPVITANIIDCEGTVEYEYTYEDCTGLQFVWTYTYNVIRSTIPSEHGTPVTTSSTVECESDAVAPATLPVVVDVCGETLQAPVPVITTNIIDCEGTVEYEYTYEDCAGLQFVWTYTYNVIRTTLPAEQGTPVTTSSTIECESDTVAPAILPVVADVCGVTLQPSSPVIISNIVDCEGTVEYEYTYEDCAGLQFVWTYTYDVIRTTPPSEDGGPVSTYGGTIECESDATPPTTLPVVVDVCGETLIAPQNPVFNANLIDCEGTVEYEYTYEDCASLQFVWTYYYDVIRTIAPSEQGTPVATSSNVECESDAVAPITLPFVVDACGDTLQPPVPVITNNLIDCEGTVEYEYTYEDCAGLQFVWTYTYNVIRTTLPAEQGTPVATSSTVECENDAVAPATLPVVVDACGETLQPPVPVITTNIIDCEGTVEYEYTYEDCAGLQFIWTYTYNVIRSTIPSEQGTPVTTSSTVECESDAVAPATLPVVVDVCGETLQAPVPVITANIIDCEGTVEYEYTYEDCAGLQFVWTYTYNVIRTTLPAEQGTPVATSSTVECESDAVAPATLPVVVDVCGDTLQPPVPVITTNIIDCEGTVEYEYTYEDCAGLQFIWTYTYNVIRTTLPSEPGTPVATSSTVECESDAVAPATLPVVVDVCGATLQAPVPVITGNIIDCEGTVEYEYTFEDCAGLQFVWTYTYNVIRSTIPSEHGTPVAISSTVECESDAVAPATLPVVVDVCGETLQAPVPVITGNIIDCEGTVEYEYTFEDCAGLQFVWTYTYSVIRSTIPSEQGTPVATSSTVECESDAVAPATLPVVVDVCGETLQAPVPVITTNIIDCEGTVEYEYTYEDCAGLQFVWTYTYNVIRTTLPAEQGTPVATSSTVECQIDAVAPTTLPAVVDACGETLQPPVPVITTNIIDCEGTVEYEYTYEDCAGLQFVWTYTYNVIRTTLPAEQGTPVATSSTVECESDAVAPTTLPAVVDVCGETLQPPVPVITTNIIDCEGTVEYEYTYEDCAGLQFIWTYTYSVIRSTAPSEHGTPVAISSTVECESDAVAPTTLPVVVDACGETLQPPVPAITTNIIDCEGTVEYEYTYEDCAGLQFVWTYTYSVIRSTIPSEQGTPVATSSTVECESDAVAPATLPVVVDVCGETLQPPVPAITANIIDCEGTVEYEYTYEDCAGLQFVWTYTYNVIRSTIPSEQGTPVTTSSTVECESDAVAPTTLPAVVDVCGETLQPPVPAITANIIDCEGTVEYEYTYEDCAGLQFVWTYTYNVIRTTLPAEQGTPVATSSTVECESDAVAPTTLPVVVDACGETLQPPVPVITANIIDCEGTVEYEYTYEDCAGLQFVWTYTYNVDLVTPPAVPADGQYSVPVLSLAIQPTTPIVDDHCGNAVPHVLFSVVDDPDPIVSIGTRTYTYHYTDCANNTSVWKFVYDIDPSTIPAFPPDDSSYVECFDDAVDPIPPSYFDGCNTMVTPVFSGVTDSLDTSNCSGTRVYTYDYTDCYNQTYVWTFTYFIYRTTPPSEHGTPVATSSTIECESDALTPSLLPVVVDVCDDTLSAPAPVITNNIIGCEGAIEYEYTYEDCAGLQFVWTYTYNIIRSTLPSEHGTPVATSSIVECESDALTPSSLPIVVDVCGDTLLASSPVITNNIIGCEGTIEYEYTYEDCAGSQFVWTYTYNVIRSTVPSEHGTPVATSSTVECESDAVTPVSLPIVVDVCGDTLVAPVPVVNYNIIDCEGTVEYEYTYEDCAGSQFVWTYTYDVIRSTVPSEHGTPVATSSSVECESDAVTPVSLPIVVDVCGDTLVAPVPVITYNIIDCEGTVEYEYTYEDCAGLQFVWTYTYDVIRSTIPSEQGTPVATSSTVECESDAVAPTTLPAVVDVCGETLQPPVPAITTNIIDCEGTVEYEYTYEDCAGSQFVWTFTYDIIRTTIPSEHGTPVTISSTVECESDAIAPSLLPIVVDVCGDTLSAPSPVTTNNIVGCEGTIEYEYTYEDCAGSQFIWTYTYNVDLTIPPAVPADDSATVASAFLAVPPSTPTVTDYCGDPVTAVPFNVVDSPDPIVSAGTRTYIYHYDDCAGNRSEWQFVYTIDPALIPPFPHDDSTYVECVADAVMPSPPQYIDACNDTITPVLLGIADSPDPIVCNGRRIYTFEYIDCNNQTYIWTFTYIIERTTAPAEHGTPVATSSTVECENDAIPPSLLPFVVDVCNDTLTHPVPVITANIIDCEGTVEYEYTYEDCAGLQFVWTYTYDIIRTTTPSEHGTPVATSTTVECESDAVAPSLLPVVVDACGDTLSAPAPVITNNIIGCEGTIEYEYTYEDCAGLQFIWTYTYNVDLTIPPAVPVDDSATVAYAILAVTPTTPTVTDYCGDPVTAVLFNVVDSPDPIVSAGTRTYIYHYDDCAGNRSEWRFVYTIDPALIPQFPHDDSTYVECVADAVMPSPPQYVDACNDTITPVLLGITDNPDPVVCNGRRIYTFEYIDCNNQTYIWTFTYIIERTTAPSEHGAPVAVSTTVECENDAIPPSLLPFVVDVCNDTLTHPVPVITANIIDCEGTVEYEYTYEDCAGLQFVWTYTYDIIRTTTPSEHGTPVATLSTVECESDAVTPSLLPVVVDVCGDTLSAPSPVITNNIIGCEGTIEYEYTYEDCAGLQFIWTYTYNIDLTIPPAVPADDSATVPSVTQAITPSTPTVTDYCGNHVTPVLFNIVDSPDPIIAAGTRTYIYHYDDCAGNRAEWNFVYSIDPSLAPPLPPDDTLYVECPVDAVIPVPPQYIDACNDTVAPVISAVTDIPNPIICNGERVYTFEYNDCNNYTQLWSYTYIIERTTTPSEYGTPVTVSSTVECESNAVTPATLPVVVDACGDTLIAPIPVITANIIDCEGTVEYEYTYEDCAGLQFVWTYTYDIIRTTTPSEHGTPVAASSTVECESDAVTPSLLPIVVDVCGDTLLASSPVITNNIIGCEGTIEYEYTYEDCAGLQFVWTYTYNINRSTLPSEHGTPVATSSTVECESDAVVPSPLPIVVDVCGDTLSAPSPVITNNIIGCEGTIEYEYTYEDCAGLQFVWTYTYNVLRTTSPSEYGTPVATSSSVECESNAVAPSLLPIVVDVCGDILLAPSPVITNNIIGCEGTIEYEYTYEDCAGLQFVWTYTYNVLRTTSPSEYGTPVAISSSIECESNAVAPSLLPIVVDVCGDTLPAPSPVITNNIIGCEGTIEYEYTYEDCAGLQFIWTYTYIVDLTIPPAVPADDSATVAYAILAVPPTLPIVTDYCGDTLTAVLFNIVDSPDPIVSSGTRTYIYHYDDCAGNRSEWQFVYTIDPALIPPFPHDDSTYVECVADAVIPSPPQYIDACNDTLTPVLLGIADSPDPIVCNGRRIYTFEYIDCNNQTYIWTFTYIIERTTAPLEHGTPVAASSTVECESNAVVPAILPLVIDICHDTLPAPVPVVTTNIIGCEGTVEYEYTYIDCAGLQFVWTYTYHIDLNTPPSVPANDTSYMFCVAAITAPVPPQVFDYCGNNVIPVLQSITDIPDPIITTGFRIYEYLYTDCAGNHSVWNHVFVIDSMPLPSIDPLPANVCIDASPLTLSATPSGGVYSGTGVTGNNFHPDVAGAGNHVITYTYTDTSNCSVSVDVNINVVPLPMVSLGGLATSYCIPSTQTYTLAGLPSGGVFSGPGVTGNTFSPQNAGAGSMTVVYTYTDQYGCVNSDSAVTTVNSTIASFTGLGTNYCLNSQTDTLIGSTSGGFSGVFSGPGIMGDRFDPSLAGSGTHTITYTLTDSSTGCTNTATQNTVVYALPYVSIVNLPSGVCIYNNPLNIVTSPTTGGTLTGNGIVGNTFDPAIAGQGTHTIIFSFTDVNGCANVDTQNIVVYTQPHVSFAGLDSTYCEEDSASVLTGMPPGGVFSGPGVIGNSFIPGNAHAGIHSITYTYTDVNGCSNDTTVTTQVFANPNVDIGPDQLICANHIITLDAGANATEYIWSTGDTTQTIIVDASLYPLGNNQFYVTVTNENNCSTVGSVTITIDPCEGIEEETEFVTIELFPNPSKGKFNLVISNVDDKLDMRIYNDIGQLIKYEVLKTYNKNNFVKTVDISVHPAGIYFIKLTNDEIMKVVKVIINK